MNKLKIKSGVAVLCAAAIAVLPWPLHAQNTNKPAAKETRAKKPAVTPAVTPFRGKLKALDKTAKTISVGELTIQVTSETKILKAEKPAVLEDGVVGEIVSGAYQKSEDGKLHATRITFGTKADSTKEKEKDKEKAKDKDKEKAKM